MIRISLPWMIDLASKLNELDKVQAGKTVGDCLLELYDAKIGLLQLRPLSRPPARRRHDARHPRLNVSPVSSVSALHAASMNRSF